MTLEKVFIASCMVISVVLYSVAVSRRISAVKRSRRLLQDLETQPQAIVAMYEQRPPITLRDTTLSMADAVSADDAIRIAGDMINQEASMAKTKFLITCAFAGLFFCLGLQMILT